MHTFLDMGLAKASFWFSSLKSFYDAEARVTGYEPGKGKNKGITGALKCVMESGKVFIFITNLSFSFLKMTVT